MIYKTYWCEPEVKNLFISDTYGTVIATVNQNLKNEIHYT